MNYLDYTVIVIYILGFLYLGKRFSDSTSGKDYFLGSKSFGWFPLSLSTAATQLSAISFISAPAFVGLKPGGGMKWLTYEFAVPLAMLFLMVFLIPPMYKAGLVSVYEYLERRYSSSTRVLLSIVFQISRGFATAVMVYTVALILTAVMDIPMWQTILIIGAVTLIYSYQGGMKAVVYGDVIQMIILFGGIVICLIAGLHYLGGWEVFTENLDRDRLNVINFSAMGLTETSEDFGFWPMLIGGFFLYVSYYGTDQSQVQRLFSAQDLPTVKKALLCNGLMRFPVTLVYCIMGLIIGTLVTTQADFASLIPADKPDYMIPIFIREYLPHGIIGILIVAIFSAAMSSLSSAINSLSAASVEDLFNRNKDLPDNQYMRLSKITAIFWGVFCLVLAFFVGDIAKTVIEAINKIGSVFYGPILATFIAAIGFKRTNSVGANVGLLTGVLFNVYLWLYCPQVFWFWWNFIGAAITFITSLVVSYVFRASANKDAETLTASIEMDAVKVGILAVFFVFIILLSLWLPSWF